MTQFEFISVALSIVLGLSLARLLAAVPQVLAPGRRYWVHALWVAMMVPLHVGFWWAIWEYRVVDDWSFRAFAASMMTPTILYLTVVTLTSEVPTTVASWKTHFFARRRAFFSLCALFSFSVPLRQLAVVGSPAVPEIAPFEQGPAMAIALVFFGTGLFAKAERIHGCLALVAAGSQLWVFSQL